MNALARAIFFGKHGELRERALQDQLQRSSALNLLKKTEQFDEELLKHISPLGWEHINFLGEYRFSKKEIALLDSLRPLQTT